MVDERQLGPCSSTAGSNPVMHCNEQCSSGKLNKQGYWAHKPKITERHSGSVLEQKGIWRVNTAFCITLTSHFNEVPRASFDSNEPNLLSSNFHLWVHHRRVWSEERRTRCRLNIISVEYQYAINKPREEWTHKWNVKCNEGQSQN